MVNIEREFGYSCDLALQNLMYLFASSATFKNDLHGVMMLPGISLYVKKRVYSGDRKDPMLESLINHKNSYAWLTGMWRKQWKMLNQNISPVEKMKVEEVAKKWGLKCNWGCGFIIGEQPSFYAYKFLLTPVPPVVTKRLSIDIGINDTKYSIDHKLIDLKTRAKKSRMASIKELEAFDFRCFGKDNKKDIGTQIQLLFWRITPPYFTAEEIAENVTYSDGSRGSEYYIRDCYSDMAKLLGIKLVKGWTKGRKRDFDHRSNIRVELIKLKMTPKI